MAKPLSVPRVSVGMPVYNGAATFERALTAMLGQTVGDLEVIVSDNGSTDATGEIARRYAVADRRVRYVRQDPPLTPYDNFRCVLAEARAPYFTWAAADDYARPTLLERACTILDARPDVVCAVPGVEFVEVTGATHTAPGAFPLLGTPKENVRTFLREPIDNSRFYGVFRRRALAAAVPETEFYAVDWAISLGTLLTGKHARIPETLLVREANEQEKYLRLIDSYYRTRRARLFALVPFTRYVLFHLRPPLSAGALFHLLRLNLWIHIAYCRYRYPRYGRPIHRLARIVDAALARVIAPSRPPAA